MAERDDLTSTLRTIEPFAALSEDDMGKVMDCTTEVTHHQGDLLVRQGGEADHLNLIEHGTVALEIHVPGRNSLVVETIGPGDIVGWSWLVAPYIAKFDARAVGVVRSLRIEAACLRAIMSEHPIIAAPIYQHFLGLLSHRLTAAQWQLADIYSHPKDYLPTQTMEAQALPPAKPSPGKMNKKDKAKVDKKKGKKS